MMLSPMIGRTTSSVALARSFALAALYTVAFAAGIGIARALPIENAHICDI